MLRLLEHHSEGALWDQLKQEQGTTSGLLRFWMKEFVSQSEGPILPQHCPCQQPIRSPHVTFIKTSDVLVVWSWNIREQVGCTPPS